jgi:hypothetical protein
MLVIEGYSKEDVIESLKKDIYYRSGVWNLDATEVIPMTLAFVKPPAASGN